MHRPLVACDDDAPSDTGVRRPESESPCEVAGSSKASDADAHDCHGCDARPSADELCPVVATRANSDVSGSRYGVLASLGDVEEHNISANIIPSARAAFPVLEVAVPMGGSVCEECVATEDAPLTPRAHGERIWPARRRRRLGPLAAHARFLQYIFRRTTQRRPGCWQRGGLRGLWPLYRPRPRYACDGGRNLARDSDFEEQARVGEEVVQWYTNYVDLLRRLRAGQTPTSLELFCGGGGKSEGVRRARGASHGVDSRAQPDYVRRFGEEAFTRADATSAVAMARLARKVRAVGVGASPPCKQHSTAWVRGEASEPDLIAITRATLVQLGLPYAIENVVGAGPAMRDPVELRGSMFGLRVDRPRLFESSFGVHVDRALEEGGRRLRAGCCLGERRRWRRQDAFGRPEATYCCAGNTFAVQGDKPWRCSLVECAAAMGADADHMSYVSLAQSIPPAYGSLVFAQMCMHVCVKEFGAPRITYDDFEASPEEASASLGSWLRGAGAAEGEAALEEGGGREEDSRDATGEPVEPVAAEPSYSPPEGGDSDESEPPTEARVREAELRELYYSHAGGFDQQLAGGRDDQLLDALGPNAKVHEASDPWAGRNTLVHVGRDRLRALLPRLRVLARVGTAGRVAVITEDRSLATSLRAAGFELVRRTVRGVPAYATDLEHASAWRAVSMLACGRVHDEDSSDAVDFELAEANMDPRDLAKDPEEPYAKALRSYMPIGVDPSRWAGLSLADDLAEMMRGSGARIQVEVEPGFAEHPFYPARDPVGLMKSITEVDRALITGSMEYVPAEEVARVMSESVIHPWTMADQGGGKWRACQDYSNGTNRYVRSAPFGLPEVWDVTHIIKPNSHFAKYDIRDGFWHCPVAPDSRRRLVLRHPGNGRLVWSTRLPFGFLDSPRLFCGVTEAIAQAVRARAASEGAGVHVFVFVDDYLIVGDSKEETALGSRWLEEELQRRGIEWAPHKHRGPCRCIEFLGLMLCNVEGQRVVSVSRARLRKTREEIDGWLARKPRGGEQLEVDPTELARLLGRLVFVSQVVRGGRTYMQGMLAAFKGLVVDWRRHVVSAPSQREWKSMRVGPAFWRDLEWWSDHVERRHSRPLQPRAHGSAAITGTDASGWGTGQVAWLDGGREETRLRFTAAERRRPINWRELLGVLRVVEQFGARLSGRTVLVETDNMAARGAAGKRKSRAPDMQELVRRLLRLCERFDIDLKVTHTPGEKLDRPDQTSRGDPVEEPRVRLTPTLFRAIERRWGPFDSLVGPERAMAQRVESAKDSRRMWVHPTLRTVGSGLRLVTDRMAASSQQVEAIAVVPQPASAAWGKLLRHGRVVGELPAGVGNREAHTPNGWMPLAAHQPALIVSFPRAAGAFCRPVVTNDSETTGGGRRADGYAVLRLMPLDSPCGNELYLPLLPGSYVYRPAAAGEVTGRLYRVAAAFDPAGIEAGRGEERLLVAATELRPVAKGSPLSRGARGPVYELSHRALAQSVSPRQLFVVDHLTSAIETGGGGRSQYVCLDRATAEREARAWASQAASSVQRATASAEPARPAAAPPAQPKPARPSEEEAQLVGQRLRVWWTGERKWFAGVVRACSQEAGRPIHEVLYEADGAARWHRLSGRGAVKWQLLPAGEAAAASAPATGSRAVSSSNAEQSGGPERPPGHDYLNKSLGSINRDGPRVAHPVGDDGARLLSDSISSLSLEGRASPANEGVESSSAGGEAAGSAASRLEAARSQLARLNLQAAATTRGPEGRIATATGKQPATEPMAAATNQPPQRQPNRYEGMRCRGCSQPFVLGQTMVAAGDGLAHDNAECRRLAEAAVAADITEGRGASAGPPRFFVVTKGRHTGLFTDRVAAVEAAGSMSGVRVCSTLAEAREAMGQPAGAQQSHAGPSSSLSRMPAKLAALVPGGAASGSVQRRAHLSEKLSDGRIAVMMCCIEGRCGVTTEKPKPCLGGCGRTLHMLTCARVGKGYAALGNFRCPSCRAKEMVAEGEPTEAVLRRAAKTMVLEMTQGAESTAGSYAEYVRLAEEYASGSGMAQTGGRLMMPHDSLEACKDFVTWLTLEDERALSLQSTLRGGEAYVTKTSPQGATNVFKSPALAAHVKTLEGNVGVESAPRTTATRRMLGAAVDTAIPEQFPPGKTEAAAVAAERLQSRWALEVVTEGVGGARVGEAVGAGDFHGLTANNTCIIAHPSCTEKWNKEVVEMKLEHSKTGHPRYLNVAGVTQLTDIRVADTLRRYWRAAGLDVRHDTEAGAAVERPDYWVVRVSLLSMTAEEQRRLLALLEKRQADTSAKARQMDLPAHARACAAYVRQRSKATGVGAQAKMYVNIAGGAANGEEITEAVAALEAAGFKVGENGHARVVPGPLIRATSGYLLTHMPLQTSSTFKTIKAITERACTIANSVTPDPELDLQSRAVAAWTNHSWRRLADTTARRTRLDTRFGRDAVEPWEIDLLFGWNEAEMEKEMQLHYAAMGLLDRIKQARITCMM